MTVPNTIAPNEALGRGVFSSKERDRAQRLGEVRLRVFLEKRGNTEISVDRLDHGSPEELTEIGNRVAAAREGKRTFYGWAVVAAKDASANQRRVKATPKPDNPYHADIVLPNIASEDREEQIRHAQELADVSCWRDPPNPP